MDLEQRGEQQDAGWRLGAGRDEGCGYALAPSEDAVASAIASASR
jgi:hypothetical protein